MRHNFLSVTRRISQFSFPGARPLIAASFLAASLLGPAACDQSTVKRTALPPGETPAAPGDLCALLRAEELERIFGEKPAKTTKSENISSGFLISQCVFHFSTPSNSIVVSVTRRASGPGGRDPRAFLQGKIEERERGEGGENESEKPLDFVPDVGDRAIWIGTSVGGTFYVLKDHLYLQIGVGTTKDPASRREKTIELGKLIAARL